MQAIGAPPPDPQPPSQRYPAEPSSAAGNRPPDRRQRSKALDYTLKGLGLLGVAVVSGFAWWLVRNNPAPPTPPKPAHASGQYQFTVFHQPTPADDCAAHSTGRVKQFLAAHPCQELIRSLWETTLPDHEQVIVSVAEVKLGDPDVAKALNTLAHADGTGNVRDLPDEGVEVPDGPKSLANGGYASKAEGGTVIIVLSEYLDPTKDTSQTLFDDRTLKAVSAAALRQGIGVS